MKFELRCPEDSKVHQLDQLAKKHRRSRNEEILFALDHWLAVCKHEDQKALKDSVVT